MVMSNKAILDGAFYTACWMSWRRQDVEVKVHFLLEDFCVNLGFANHYYKIEKSTKSEGLLSAISQVKPQKLRMSSVIPTVMVLVEFDQRPLSAC